MALTDVGELPSRGRILVDSAPIIYFLEGHRELAPRYASLFECAEAGDYELVVTTVTLAEVLTGPLRTGDEALAQRYRSACPYTVESRRMRVDASESGSTWRLGKLIAACFDDV